MSSGSSVFSTPTPRELADEQSARALAGFRDLWSNWLRDAGLLLHSHDARPQDPAPELKLLRMRQQLMPKMHALRQEYPCLSKAVFMYNLETGEREGAPVSHWAAVARSMALSPDQLAACLAALTMYRERAAPALAERDRLASEVVAGLRAVCGAAAGSSTADSSEAGRGGGAAPAPAAPAAGPADVTPEAVLRLCEGTEVLSRNISAEGQAIDIVKDFLSNGVMSVVQLARIAVLSYPWFPDALALLTTLEDMHLQRQRQAAAEAAAAAAAEAAAAATAC
ncbi:hypothetical protein HXX76_015517 [Chlamydomonas incerta]|uniref:Uncharacterized protein n=1 Tax=Chlamydomonas incerta TaxID=51695 RepID=A0A835VNA5_CHLIN|nr:hypothetical protein HXX76_015517 [Chlamydomonas incerta]|eukprot:KAG2423132.1 hypothetical protein HXX76_015517 [Chlamydomonas incerta]